MPKSVTAALCYENARQNSNSYMNTLTPNT